ncbi:RdgB/HAM1 family non-canonical purine NTP pyrophosphatase [soil metagenome]
MTPSAATLVLATHNAGKVAELRAILAGLDVTLIDAATAALPEVEETGDTFSANALLKARAGVAASGLPCVADDSGLAVDALDGAPGILSARWARVHDALPDAQDPDRADLDRADVDRANLHLVLEQLRDVPADRRTARFVCAAALALPDGTWETVEATLVGSLLTAPRGEGGFGYDPLFLPRGGDRTTAEMTSSEKHAISHRGKAFRALRPVIARHLGGT